MLQPKNAKSSEMLVNCNDLTTTNSQSLYDQNHPKKISLYKRQTMIWKHQEEWIKIYPGRGHYPWMMNHDNKKAYMSQPQGFESQDPNHRNHDSNNTNFQFFNFLSDSLILADLNQTHQKSREQCIASMSHEPSVFIDILHWQQ